MQLNKAAEIAFTLLWKMSEKPNKWSSVADISRTTDCSESYAGVVISKIHRAGLLQCKTGRGGGYKFSVDRVVTAFDVMEALEGPQDEPTNPLIKLVNDGIRNALKDITFTSVQAETKVDV